MTCANTRWRNTCITTAGFGNTAVMIWASWPTVTLISSYKLDRPGSDLGAGDSGSGKRSQLRFMNSDELVRVGLTGRPKGA